MPESKREKRGQEKTKGPKYKTLLSKPFGSIGRIAQFGVHACAPIVSRIVGKITSDGTICGLTPSGPELTSVESNMDIMGSREHAQCLSNRPLESTHFGITPILSCGPHIFLLSFLSSDFCAKLCQPTWSRAMTYSAYTAAMRGVSYNIQASFIRAQLPTPTFLSLHGSGTDGSHSSSVLSQTIGTSSSVLWQALAFPSNDHRGQSIYNLPMCRPTPQSLSIDGKLSLLAHRTSSKILQSSY